MALPFHNRRSPVMGMHAAVSSSQSLASQAGLDILKNGGNAVDASITMAACLNVLEPSSTGIGGDMFAIFYDAKTKQVEGINGSGRCPAALSLEVAREAVGQECDSIPHTSVHAVTVPGAAQGWCDALKKWGTMSLAQVLDPAIRMCEEGVPIGVIAADLWSKDAAKLKAADNGAELLNEAGEAPAAGDIMRNPSLAKTFRLLAEKGPEEGFYRGPVADAIVDAVQREKGVLSHQDLEKHKSTFPDPISVNYKGVTVYEMPPSGQGLTALLALNILKDLPISDAEHNSANHLHTLIEAMRIAFADSRWYVADPAVESVPVSALLSPEYAAERRKLINDNKATVDVKKGSPVVGCDTVSFCVVDQDGNACSFINSTYCGFGTGIVPKGTGFTLQNRGSGFSLDPEHPNRLQPGKRPYHTIIPGMATRDGDLWAPFSVMGGFNQPQGHVQVLVNMIDFGMCPQQALDAPRFCITNGQAGGTVAIEDTLPIEVIEELRQRGHTIQVVGGFERSVCGRGQIIRKMDNGVLWCGSDGRGDGAACAF